MVALKFSVIVQTIFLLMMACQQAPDPGSSTNLQALGARVPIERLISPLSANVSEKLISDGFKHTFSITKLNLAARDGIELEDQVRVKTQRFVSSPDLIEKEPSQVAAFRNICRDLALLDANGQVVEGKTVSSSQDFQLIWRTHHSDRDLSVWGGGSLESGDNSECILLLEVVGQRNAKSSLFIEFTFAFPGGRNRSLMGAESGKPFEDEALLLLDRNLLGYVAINRVRSNTFEVSEPPKLVKNQVALNRTEVTIESIETGRCDLLSLDGFQSVAADETSQFQNSYSVFTAVDSVIKEGLLTSTAGISGEACEKSYFQVVGTKQVKVNMNCSEFYSAWSKTPDSACRFALRVANSKDPNNEIYVPVSNIDLKFNNINVENIGDAYKNFPKAERNPVRKQVIDLPGFDSQRAEVLAKGFDLWLDLDAPSYQKYFREKILKITYVGSDCEVQGGGGYAYANAKEFFWCVDGAMSDMHLEDVNAPDYLTYISITAFHETLHTHGLLHDFQNQTYKPCEGTSQSAKIAKELVLCTSPYCYAFKDFGLQYYINELNYSLSGDGRRFQGTCQKWNSELNVTAAAF